MLSYKCKMFGGELNIIEGGTVCEYEFCGTKQTVPTADNQSIGGNNICPDLL